MLYEKILFYIFYLFFHIESPYPVISPVSGHISIVRRNPEELQKKLMILLEVNNK